MNTKHSQLVRVPIHTIYNILEGYELAWDIYMFGKYSQGHQTWHATSHDQSLAWKFWKFEMKKQTGN